MSTSTQKSNFRLSEAIKSASKRNNIVVEFELNAPLGRRLVIAGTNIERLGFDSSTQIPIALEMLASMLQLDKAGSHSFAVVDSEGNMVKGLDTSSLHQHINNIIDDATDKLPDDNPCRDTKAANNA